MNVLPSVNETNKVKHNQEWRNAFLPIVKIVMIKVIHGLQNNKLFHNRWVWKEYMHHYNTTRKFIWVLLKSDCKYLVIFIFFSLTHALYTGLPYQINKCMMLTNKGIMQHHVNKLEIFRGHQNSVIFSGVEKYIRMLSSSNTHVFIILYNRNCFTKYGVYIKHNMANVTGVISKCKFKFITVT